MLHALRILGFVLLLAAAVPFVVGLVIDWRTKMPDMEKTFREHALSPAAALLEFDRQWLIWLRATLRQMQWWVASNWLMIPAVLCLGIAIPQWYLKLTWLLIAAVRIAMLPKDRQRLAYWRGRIAEAENSIVVRLRPDEEAERILRENP